MEKERINKIFVVNKGYHNYNKAERFGEIQYITEGRVNIFQTDNLKEHVERGLDSFQLSDYLLISGQILPNALALHCLLNKFDTVNVLIWFGDKGEYQRITIRR